MRPRTGIAVFVTLVGAAGALAVAAGSGTAAHAASSNSNKVKAGDLLVSGTIYMAPNIVAGTTQLPPGCAPANCVTATAGSAFPQVFNNANADASFGTTSQIFLDELTTDGRPNGRIMINPNDMATSFSSKSELAVNLSPDGKYVTWLGYAAKPGNVDVSNSSTPGEPDPENPIPATYYRAVGQLDANGNVSVTKTNAFTGDNGRAAIAATVDGNEVYYAAGNASSVETPQLPGTIVGAGAQLITPGSTPGTPTPVGSFSVTQLGDKADKAGKDDNFRGIAIYNNVLYYTKGSGSNGVNTVYYVDTTGSCKNGVGIPSANATLPTTPLSVDLSTVQTAGLPSNMCILKGFPTVLAKGATDASDYPFGIWFANPTTLYVADEGAGDNAFSGGTYTAAAASTTAGIQKWVYNATAGEWQLAYTLQSGLNLGQPYTISGYPTGTNSATGLPWSPATDGLRSITGKVNSNGTVSLWAVSSTVSGGGDQGADPNRLVEINDNLAATSRPSGESFKTVETATLGQLYRGVTFTPGTDVSSDQYGS